MAQKRLINYPFFNNGDRHLRSYDFQRVLTLRTYKVNRMTQYSPFEGYCQQGAGYKKEIQ